MAKRVNGEGSWGEKKVGNITYKRFSATINGERHDFYGHTKTEARNKYEKWLETHSTAPKKTPLTLSEAAWDMLALKKSQIKQTTYRAYEAEIKFLDRHPIHRQQVFSLQTKEIQEYIDSLADEKSIKGIKNQKLILKMAIDYCLDFGYIKEDVLKKVKLPNEIYVRKPTRQITFLTTDERHHLEEETKRTYSNGKPVYTGNAKHVVVFILHTGLRISELIALTWDDYDRRKGRIHVSKNAPTVKTDKGYEKVVTTPKTKNAIRNVPLDPTAKRILDLLYKNRKSDIIFCSETGTMLSGRNVSRTLDSMVKRAGLDKRPTLHDLRHTYASELIRNGADIKTVSKVLGHANVSTTLNIYVHKSDDDIDNIKGLID